MHFLFNQEVRKVKEESALLSEKKKNPSRNYTSLGNSLLSLAYLNCWKTDESGFAQDYNFVISIQHDSLQ